MEENKLVFQKNVLINGKIMSKTGLHIGSVKEELEIGGTDNPVIKDPKTGKALIPGSSLKGKIRALLELRDGKYDKNTGDVHKCSKIDCEICTIFGSSEDVNRGPTRLIVRDGFINEGQEPEIKAENVINRLTGKSEIGPRFIERVPAGSEFNLDMIYSIYNDNDYDNLKLVFECMNQLEDNYLGGSGSRGYGKVKFENIEFRVKTKKDYVKGKEGRVITLEGKDKFTVSEILDKFEELKKEVSK